jgi:hypothetical protein
MAAEKTQSGAVTAGRRGSGVVLLIVGAIVVRWRPGHRAADANARLMHHAQVMSKSTDWMKSICLIEMSRRNGARRLGVEA